MKTRNGQKRLVNILPPVIEPKPVKKNEFNWERVINIASLVVTTGIGALAVIIAIQSKNESVTNTQFKDLVDKTNSVMVASQNQLKLNEDSRALVEKGDKNRFIAAIFRLGANIGNKDSAKYEMKEEGDSARAYVDRLIPIFESQMNNPYLCRNDTMLGLWINAYVHLNIIGHMGSFDDSFDESFDVRTGSRIDEISKVKMNRDFISVWGAVNEAYLYCGKKLKTESSGFLKK